MGAGTSKRQDYLSGKHVLITGGSEGIGLALGKECYKRLASVTLLARTHHKLEAAIAEVQAIRADRVGSVRSCPADVTQADQASLLCYLCITKYAPCCLTRPVLACRQSWPLTRQAGCLQVAQAISSLQQQNGSVDVVICCAGRAEPGKISSVFLTSTPLERIFQ